MGESRITDKQNLDKERILNIEVSENKLVDTWIEIAASSTYKAVVEKVSVLGSSEVHPKQNPLERHALNNTGKIVGGKWKLSAGTLLLVSNTSWPVFDATNMSGPKPKGMVKPDSFTSSSIAESKNCRKRKKFFRNKVTLFKWETFCSEPI